MFLSFWQIVVFVLSILKLSSINCKTVTVDVLSVKKTVSSMSSTQGIRKHMEDTLIQIENVLGTGIYAIFDGHTGNYSSIHAADRFTEMIEKELRLSASNPKACSFVEGPDGTLNNEQMLRHFIERVENHLESATMYEAHRSGTTCLLVLADKNKLTVANVGDSRGVLCNNNGKALNLTIDHKPNNKEEKKRIEQAGGEIYESHPGIWRVNGLAMSRSLGDNLKKRGDGCIIATPDIFIYDLNKHQPQFMILASDGLWDVMSSQDAVDFIKERYLNQTDFGAEELVIRALHLESQDNITVLIIIFRNGHYEVGSANSSNNK